MSMKQQDVDYSLTLNYKHKDLLQLFIYLQRVHQKANKDLNSNSVSLQKSYYFSDSKIHNLQNEKVDKF